MALFKIEEVKKTFTNGEVKEEILKGINLSLKEGEIIALVGASGSGKSTLLTIAAGLQPASGGQVVFEGESLNAMSPEQIRKIRASKFGFVFQFAHLVPFLTVEEQLSLMLDVSESRLDKREQKREIKKQRAYSETRLPESMDYTKLPGLSNEVKQKLTEFAPKTIGHAARIQGITPAALSALLVHLKKQKIKRAQGQ